MSGKSVPEPNYTQAPNFFFDHIMLEITSTAELKVTLAVIRQTFGYHKKEDQLSLSRLVELTGLSRKSVADGVKAALQRGYVGRRKHSDTYIYGLRVASEESTLPPDPASEESTPIASEESTPTKESKKESNEANASRPKAKTVGLEKYITDRLYDAYKQGGYPKWTKDEYGFHLGRCKKILEENEPTDEEIERLPSEFVAYYTDWNPKADAVSTLREMRRKASREQNADRRSSGPASWEPINPHSPRPTTLSDDELAKRRAEREELGRQMAEARARDKAGMSHGVSNE